MPIQLKDFISRAERSGSSRIRLSGKPSDEQVLSRHKGSLGGKVVEAMRGSREVRRQENKKVTDVFFAALVQQYGAKAVQGARARLPVDEGKPLLGRDVKTYVTLTEAVAAEHKMASESIAQQAISDLLDEGNNTLATWTDGLAASIGCSKAEMDAFADQLRNPDSPESQAFTAAVTDQLVKAGRTGDPANRAEMALKASFRDQALRFIVRDDDKLLSQLVRAPAINLFGQNVPVADLLVRLLQSEDIDPGRKAAIAHAMVDAASDLVGMNDPTRAEDLLKPLFGEDALHRLMDEGQQASTMALYRDVLIQVSHTLDTRDRVAVLETALKIECARQVALPADQRGNDPIDALLDLQVQALEGSGSLGGVASENRQTLDTMRAKLGALVNHSSGAELQGYITTNARVFTTQLMQQAIRALGEPPCAYAVVTLGSTSRGEASPYSDIEFGVVLPDSLSEDDLANASGYFERMAKLMRAQVVALGEFGQFGLPERLHWDPAGLSPAEKPREFIGRPRDLVAMAYAAQADGTPHEQLLFTMYLNAEELHASVDGNGLVAELHTASTAHFLTRGAGLLNKGERLGGWLLTECLGATGDMLPSRLQARIRAHEAPIAVDVKKLSRLPMLMVQALCLKNSIYATTGTWKDPVHSTHMRINELVIKEALSPAQGEQLIEAFDILARVRVAAHLGHGTANDEVLLGDHPDLERAINLLRPFETLVDRLLSPLAESAYGEPYTF